MIPWIALQNVRTSLRFFGSPHLPHFCEVAVILCVHYTDGYPDELPELSLRVEKGTIDDEDSDHLISQLKVAV